MFSEVKILSGKLGFALRVDGLYIRVEQHKIIAIKSNNPIPYGATEWVSVEALRKFWNENRQDIMASLAKPHASLWGQFIPLETELA
jgi:hypothetical protein